MTTEIIIVFCVLLISVVLFAFEVFPVDKIAFFILVSLLVFGLLKPEEAISGFSSPATISILCLMIIAIGLEDNGVISWLSKGLEKIKILPLLLIIPLFMFITGVVSSFISTTAVVIVFIKIITDLSRKYKIPKGKLLLPVSFAGILGGSCTLMGTSTNLIINSVVKKSGIEGFTFFEFSLYGLLFLVIGIIVVTFLSFLLPTGNNEEFDVLDKNNRYLTTVQIKEGSELIDKTIEETYLFKKDKIKILKLIRAYKSTKLPGKYIKIKANDIFVISGDAKSIFNLKNSTNYLVNYSLDDNKEIEVENEINYTKIIDLVVLPGSPLINKKFTEIKSYMVNGAKPLGFRNRKKLPNFYERIMQKNIDDITINLGDQLLVEIPENRYFEFSSSEYMTVNKDFDFTIATSKTKRNITFLILLVVIGLASTSIVPILTSALIGCALLLAFNCIKLGEVYKKVNWEIIFLLAGMIPIGIAMENSGADKFLTAQLLELCLNKEPYFIIGVLFLTTMIISGFISNNATAIIITPIAIALAQGMDLPVKPFILSVLFAANFSFFTPMGYQTNTIIYGLNVYKFKHFFVVGGVLSIILWIVATFVLSRML
ncbi:sodium:proton antiporter [Flavobacterium gelidilacus]|uniref:SLC13 family permease n=1 Tax=Flavobacterium gelidilacus TaxID=206041 RepID=UPI000479E547|nr:sodium:proton antiporter [Flavobacterium gelidilacus]